MNDENKNASMKVRNLDGAYFRVNRNGKWLNRCFTDLTFEERQTVCKGKDAEFFKDLAFHLADILRAIADVMHVTCEVGEEDD